MGGTASNPGNGDPPQHAQMARDIRMLLGNFERLDPVTQRLVGLGKKCLTATILDSQQANFKRLEKFSDEAAGNVEDDAAVEGARGSSGSSSRGVVRTSTTDRCDFQQVDLDREKGIEFEAAPICSSNIGNKGEGIPAEEERKTAELDDSRLFLPLQQARPIYSGQTYTTWKTMYQFQNLFAMCVPTKKIVYIQPIDEFPDFLIDYRITVRSLSLDMFSFLQAFTQIFFSGMDVTLLPNVSTRAMGWQDLVKSRHHSVTGQKQYRAKDFYPLLQKVLPSDGQCILGIIWTDLYPEDDLNFVLGETSFQHRAGIFCFGRFETEGFHKATHRDITDIDGLLIWKLIKASSHEMCHLFGLRHCTYFRCSMNESTSMVEALDQPLFLCPVCLRKLHQVCRFDVLDRYQHLQTFLGDLQAQHPSAQCDRAITWLQDCIRFLQQPTTPSGRDAAVSSSGSS